MINALVATDLFPNESNNDKEFIDDSLLLSSPLLLVSAPNRVYIDLKLYYY